MQHVDLSLMNRAQSTRYYPAVIYSITPVEEWALPVVIIKNKYQMHLGYTIQWALLGLVFVILFIKVGTTREQNESEQKMAT
jgi:cytochrome oxidase assembly protein ShyY1